MAPRSPKTREVLAPTQQQATTAPPPSKASLKAWWRQFTSAQKFAKKEGDLNEKPQHPVFGVPLRESLYYASVQISTANTNGELYVWGYIPVVVAKCGLYLKENATETQGVFRVSGSNKRMRDLQALFETPPKYGKNLDWKKEHYNVHDVASVFRRYLTQMPEPVIPHSLYDKFREPLSKKRPVDEMINTYKQLIRSMPRANQYLLLYVLDLLSVFARKSDINLMTATNLAVIFRPGIIAHPSHELTPTEHQLSQEVLEFLIEHQDWFMLEIPAPPTSSTPRHDSINASPLSSPLSPTPEDEDVLVVPSSDDDQPRKDSGWKLVERAKKVDRRRTLSERSRQPDRPPPSISQITPPRGTLSPVSESPTVSVHEPLGMGQATVTRSRTVPSRRTGSKDERPALEDRPSQGNVLKKQKRVSTQAQRTRTLDKDELPS